MPSALRIERIGELIQEPLRIAADAVAADPGVLVSPEMIVRLGLMILLFIASAFSLGSETAPFSLSRFDLMRQWRRERSPDAGKSHSLLDQPRQLIISILCGNQIVNLLATAKIAAILID